MTLIRHPNPVGDTVSEDFDFADRHINPTSQSQSQSQTNKFDVDFAFFFFMIVVINIILLF